MSDTPPDRKEEGDAPEAPKNPHRRLIAWLVIAPVVYVLSLAPVCWLVERHYLPEQVYYLYYPLKYLGRDALHGIDRFLERLLP